MILEKKMRKKCNSTDVADITLYCKNTNNLQYKKTWESIHWNTANLTNIISAAAIDCHIETKVSPIWEQIRAKSKCFQQQKNYYWSICKSLAIFEEWCSFHRIDKERNSPETQDHPEDQQSPHNGREQLGEILRLKINKKWANELRTTEVSGVRQLHVRELHR